MQKIYWSRIVVFFWVFSEKRVFGDGFLMVGTW